ncbi:hypothetical protein CHISP_0418 [Chitinispirillum alkaliphilum]|nr:hypothetical protein CHISP_0418 [Chitinispirillum alkaliphilum]
MDCKEMVSRITVVVNRDFLSRSPLEIISDMGIHTMHHFIGRAPVLNEKRGIVKAILNRNSNIIARPVDVVTFLVEKDLELQALQLVSDKFKLNISGSGSVYSEIVSIKRDNGGLRVHSKLSQPEKGISMQTQLTGICCIVLRGDGDTVARIALETGSCVPTVTFGKGAGLRDRLGLWRIAVPAEKEIVKMVVNSYESEEIMNIIADTLRLDQPGRGFIYSFPVSRGLINMKVSSENRSQAASMEQVIIALDELKGGTEWRRRRLSGMLQERRRRILSNLSEIVLFSDEGNVEEYVKVAMDAGAPGATVTEYRHISNHENDAISPAREKCSIILPAGSVDNVVEELEIKGVFDNNNSNDLITTPVPGALTYAISEQ